MKTKRSNITTACALSALLIILSASALCGQDTKTNAAAEASASAVVDSDTKNITVGAFTVKVPTEWASFSPSEAAALRRQYMEQSKQIYQQFAGSDNPAKSVDIAAFHILNDASSFAIVSFTVPPQSDLIALLKSQVGAKMDWGIREGYIRKYLGLVPIDDERFSGFYTKAIGKGGGVEVSGGLEHKQLKNTIVQLTLLCPKVWDEAKATKSLSAVLKSIALKVK